MLFAVSHLPFDSVLWRFSLREFSYEQVFSKSAHELLSTRGVSTLS
jgi:hypothetical protein